MGVSLTSIRKQVVRAVRGPQSLAFVPAVSLSAYWLGGEITLLIVAGTIPLLWMAFGGQFFERTGNPRRLATPGLLPRDAFEDACETVREETEKSDFSSAVLMVEFDEYHQLLDRYGQSAADLVVRTAAQRIIDVVRDSDVVSQLGDCRFGIVLGATSKVDLEATIQLSGRLQSSLEEPISVDGTTILMSACVGFCIGTRAPDGGGAEWAQAAGTALLEAQRRGPGSIRAYSTEMHRVKQARASLRADVTDALENGQIQPWYQPQVSTDTGRVTGFETLARWSHPERGLISPAEFLPAVEEAGQLERLAEVMLYQGLNALKSWDVAGLDVPHVGVNFSGSELNNPKLVSKVQWELDRFELAPERLAVEILETVVAGAADDTITRNIHGFTELGCRVDLDDFGTGHASIASIRRFGVGRIKIDRSFVMKCDKDPEQQRLVSAILTMAERLGIETLAEGVETAGEHALLSQLGCDHVQGFRIARPMPFDDTLTWIKSHEKSIERTPAIDGRRA